MCTTLAVSFLMAVPVEAQQTGNPRDDLKGLSDEFDDASTLKQWSRIFETEQSKADQLEQFDIAKTKPGWMVMVPYSSTWYMDYRGVLVYKEIKGDFVVTSNIRVARRGGDGAPRSNFSLAGLMIRTPRDVTPQTWKPGGENYIFLSLGAANRPGSFQFEVKTTVNSRSTLAVTDAGTPAAMIQIARIGNEFILLKKTPEGTWNIHQRYRRTDMPEQLQVGLTVYTDYSTASRLKPPQQNTQVIRNGRPDLVAGFDYVHFQRPALPAALQGKSLSNPAEVSDAQLLQFLGEHANN
ncbi:hypothetical protein [Gimesia sp.]|uniref:hypothetical protein n=1 Tax=Gimesia sp. TaxID=2024833 RepID=UPI000C4888B7|nr:hypothetical protein [Gimesia sp.]MAX37336.1 hypothetical protein [Gimesia sp.]HBL43427.1 hypothetical protein [Planctomycetaceae bacterium]|tara:strand:+ start:31586 stop:32470 length:885 start_codon:yes stop_codon:yes gene_type:complete